MSGTSHCVSMFPAGPLAPHLALPNRVLEGGVCIALPRTPYGLFCGAILLRDLSRSAARALASLTGPSILAVSLNGGDTWAQPLTLESLKKSLYFRMLFLLRYKGL
ncbi:MAG TPA: hypothetical protein VLG49_03385 [Rhabdochlamydiaceae bacterium]|nr:hypothetical protein [Rhabdochlamydiaceae bacterium]